MPRMITPPAGDRHLSRTGAVHRRHGVTTVLDEPRPCPVQVSHEGRWYDGDLNAYRQDRAWWGMVSFVVAVGLHWH